MITVNRNQWMDVAKGITILLMVLGHTAIPKSLSNFIYSFHMPLFFIASGWMTNWEKYSVYEFTIKKVKSLAVPFMIYSSIVLMLFEYGQSLANERVIENWLYNGWQGWIVVYSCSIYLFIYRSIHLFYT